MRVVNDNKFASIHYNESVKSSRAAASALSTAICHKNICLTIYSEYYRVASALLRQFLLAPAESEQLR